MRSKGAKICTASCLARLWQDGTGKRWAKAPIFGVLKRKIRAWRPSVASICAFRRVCPREPLVGQFLEILQNFIHHLPENQNETTGSVFLDPLWYPTLNQTGWKISWALSQLTWGPTRTLSPPSPPDSCSLFLVKNIWKCHGQWILPGVRDESLEW